MADKDNDEWFNEWLIGTLNIRPLTKRLVRNLFWDLPLSPPEVVDFGVDTDDHYRALHAVLSNDPEGNFEERDQEDVQRELLKRIVELDQALGNGSKLTALVKKYAPQYGGLVFKTSWDVIAEGVKELRDHRHGR